MVGELPVQHETFALPRDNETTMFPYVPESASAQALPVGDSQPAGEKSDQYLCTHRMARCCSRTGALS
ncbi:hypothetical protein ACIBSR_06160 [Streptomyces sp. NPDC049936]|uniref:hypothetical protein n=1 Tax=Streptomyces sp. NPDC049936 TaxID=3365599 RepID=UPI0037AC954E